MQWPPTGRGCAPYCGRISSPHTGQVTVSWTVSPSQTPAIRSSSVGSPPRPSNRLGARVASVAVTVHRPSRDVPHQADDLAEHPHISAPDWLHGLVLRLQPHVVGLLEEPLDRSFLTHQRDHDVAVAGGLLGPDHDQVTFENARVLHRLAPNPEKVLAVGTAGVRRR